MYLINIRNISLIECNSGKTQKLPIWSFYHYRQLAEYFPTNKCATIFGCSLCIFEFNRGMQSKWAIYQRVVQSPNVELQIF